MVRSAMMKFWLSTHCWSHSVFATACELSLAGGVTEVGVPVRLGLLIVAPLACVLTTWPCALTVTPPAVPGVTPVGCAKRHRLMKRYCHGIASGPFGLWTSDDSSFGSAMGSASSEGSCPSAGAASAEIEPRPTGIRFWVGPGGR